MFASCNRFGAPLLLCLIAVGSFAAPLVEQDLEVDPELSAGYFEGDMELEVGRNGEIDPAKRWPNATVYYKIDEAFNAGQVEYIMLGMQRIELASCIRFLPASPETLDYVLVTVSPNGCSSNVGFIGGEQTVKLKPSALDKGCFKLGSIQHELLHSLGFHHQHSSSDRDDFVSIVEDNIREGAESNFKKYGPDRVENFDVAYDYGSILHYSSTAFSKNGEATIVALQPDAQSLMGQRLAMSAADVLRLNTMYKCPLPL